MPDPTPDEKAPLAVLPASPARRWFGIFVLYGLGVLVLWMAFARPPEVFGWRMFLIGIGAGAIWLGELMRRGTRRRIELHPDGLFDDTGRPIAPLDEIRSMDRGTFAFKPTQGFAVITRRPLGRIWAPGLYWRLGRRVGIGGVTPQTHAKFMAEMLAGMLAEREAKEKADRGERD